MPEYWNGVITATVVICGTLNVIYTIASAAFNVIMERAEKNKRFNMVNEVVERRTPR